MMGRKSWTSRRLYLIAYWRTAEQLKDWSPSYGLSLKLSLRATKHIEIQWFVGRKAGAIELGIRYSDGK